MPVPAPGDRLGELALPDDALVDHHGRNVRLADLVAPSELTVARGHPGPPLVLLLGRGWFCPRDQAHLRHVVAGWDRLGLAGAAVAYVAVQTWQEQAAFRAGLGAAFTFLADHDRALARALDLVDDTEGEQADVLRPVALVADHDLVVRASWDGWWIDGRPGVDELLRALRDLRPDRSDGSYQGWTGERVTATRVPQLVWRDGESPPGTVARADVDGIVATWDRAAGVGTITLDDGTTATAHFTTIPGHGDRGLAVGTEVVVDVLDHEADALLATNVRSR